MKYIEEEISPEYAELLLEKNLNNRRLRKRYIDQLSESMKRGEWKHNPNPIMLSNNDILLDGQHRLLAVVKSGVTITATVCYNVNPEIFDVIDVGAKRDYADIAKISRKQANVITALFSIYNECDSSFTMQQVHMIKRIYLSTIKKLDDFTKTSRKLIGNSYFKAGAVYMMHKNKKEDFVKKAYKNIVNQEFIKMTTIQMSFMKYLSRYLENQVSLPKWDIFCISCFIFDENNQERQIIKVNNMYLIDQMRYTQRLIDNGFYNE